MDHPIVQLFIIPIAVFWLCCVLSWFLVVSSLAVAHDILKSVSRSLIKRRLVFAADMIFEVPRFFWIAVSLAAVPGILCYLFLVKDKI